MHCVILFKDINIITKANHSLNVFHDVSLLGIGNGKWGHRASNAITKICRIAVVSLIYLCELILQAFSVFALVNEKVAPQCILPRKVLPADRAVVRFVGRMHNQVTSQVTLTQELHPTCITPERFLTTVSFHVGVEVRATVETFVAHFTPK